MMIVVGLLALVVAAMIGAMLIVNNNREKADKVADKAEKIIDVLKS